MEGDQPPGHAGYGALKGDSGLCFHRHLGSGLCVPLEEAAQHEGRGSRGQAARWEHLCPRQDEDWCVQPRFFRQGCIRHALSL